MKKVLTVIGARPQFIKAAPVSKAVRKQYSEIIVHTGQHYDVDMSKVFFEQLGIPDPDYNLNVGSASHAIQTGMIMKGVEELLIRQKPDLVLLYGDTNSTLAAAITAAKLHFTIAHVEAGLRDVDLKPPEEVNRRLTDHVSDILFTPSIEASKNLYKENITQNVVTVGDVMYDAILQNMEISEKVSNILERNNLKKGYYYLATIHRPHNTDFTEVLKSIMRAFNMLDKPVLFPAHPRTKKALDKMDFSRKNIILTTPLNYFDMLKAQKNAYKIITDSGGVQKEAYLLKIPCVTISYTSPWVETIESGWNRLSDSKTDALLEAIEKSKEGHSYSNCYGDGDASEKILLFLNSYL